MIVIVRATETLVEAECARRKINIDKIIAAPDGTTELECQESERRKIREWFAWDDSVLWFSSL